MTVANWISITRILLVPFFIAAFLYSRPYVALGILIIAFLSDGLDGMLARLMNQKTALGAILDPIADKLTIVSALLCLTLIKDSTVHVYLPPYVPIVVIFRDFVLALGSGLIFMFKGRLDVSPTLLGKATTVMQMISIAASILRHDYAIVLWSIAILFTLASGFDYAVKGLKILNNGKTV